MRSQLLKSYRGDSRGYFATATFHYRLTFQPMVHLTLLITPRPTTLLPSAKTVETCLGSGAGLIVHSKGLEPPDISWTPFPAFPPRTTSIYGRTFTLSMPATPNKNRWFLVLSFMWGSTALFDTLSIPSALVRPSCHKGRLNWKP